jgi:hypothetical protein
MKPARFSWSTACVLIVACALFAAACGNDGDDRAAFSKAADAFIDATNDFKTALPSDPSEAEAFLADDPEQYLEPMKDELERVRAEAGKLDGKAGEIASDFATAAEDVTATSEELLATLAAAFTAAYEANAAAVDELNAAIDEYNAL